MKKLIGIFKLLRVKHYVKNGLVFLPLFFAKRIFEPSALLIACLGALAFSLISSIVYIINDIRDREKDRLHSTKCKRPIASGVVSPRLATVTAVGLGIAATVLLAFTKSYVGALCAVGYLLINVLYSFGMKNIPVIDVTLLVSGFVIRVIFGGVICAVEISPWLLVTVICAAFYMGFGKRRGEIVSEENETREVNKRYSLDFLDQQISVFMALILVFYSLWCITVQQNGFEWSVIIVMLIFVRYSYLIKSESDGDPVSVLLSDKFLLLLVLIYCVYVFAVVYEPILWLKG